MHYSRINIALYDSRVWRACIFKIYTSIKKNIKKKKKKWVHSRYFLGNVVSQVILVLLSIMFICLVDVHLEKHLNIDKCYNVKK